MLHSILTKIFFNMKDDLSEYRNFLINSTLQSPPPLFPFLFLLLYMYMYMYIWILMLLIHVCKRHAYSKLINQKNIHGTLSHSLLPVNVLSADFIISVATPFDKEFRRMTKMESGIEIIFSYFNSILSILYLRKHGVLK